MRIKAMPIYQYRTAANGCDHCRAAFEVMQSIRDKPLARCPVCRGPVKRIPSLCAGGAPLLSPSRLRDKGFTQLKNRGDGSFEKLT